MTKANKIVDGLHEAVDGEITIIHPADKIDMHARALGVDLDKAAPVEGVDFITLNITSTGPTIDPTETGITHLRTIDPGAIRLWSVKGPKGMAESTISGVMVEIDDVPTVVILHQFAAGKFTTFSKVAM
jgi:hypothetical protein